MRGLKQISVAPSDGPAPSPRLPLARIPADVGRLGWGVPRTKPCGATSKGEARAARPRGPSPDDAPDVISPSTRPSRGVPLAIRLLAITTKATGAKVRTRLAAPRALPIRPSPRLPVEPDVLRAKALQASVLQLALTRHAFGAIRDGLLAISGPPSGRQPAVPRRDAAAVAVHTAVEALTSPSRRVADGQGVTVGVAALTRPVPTGQARPRADHVHAAPAGLLGDAAVMPTRLLRLGRRLGDPTSKAGQEASTPAPRLEIGAVPLKRA